LAAIQKITGSERRERRRIEGDRGWSGSKGPKKKVRRRRRGYVTIDFQTQMFTPEKDWGKREEDERQEKYFKIFC